MENRIFVLEDKTINQIAAGEVIENPSSVIKELVENAIDAEATSIRIEILGGGHFKICISDDGNGMSQDDAYLAFERHATSKIRKVDDLQKLASMGFRGEALASIAACSKVELITCRKGKDVGTKVVIHGGKMFAQKPISRSHGTTIEVSSLFYNVPARKAFQKSKGQSTNDVVKMVTKLCLAHPNLAIELISHDETLLKTSGGGEHVIEEILGDTFAKEMQKISHEMSGCTIGGLISTPQNTRKNRTGQYLFINSRPVNSALISKVVQTGFGTRLSSREYPLFVLWIEIPPNLVDVNVHPQKSEVRFRNEEMIKVLVLEAIAKVFGMAEKIEDFTFSKEIETQSGFSSYVPKNQTNYQSKQPDYQNFREKTEASIAAMKLSEPTIQYELSINKVKEEKRTLTVLGIFEKYAIIQFEKGATLFGEDECDESLGFIDLPAAGKRILFDEILHNLDNQSGWEKQQLLFTETFEFTPAETCEVKEKVSFLNQMGIGVREFGKTSFVVDSLAAHIEMGNVKDLLLEMSESMSKQELAKRLCASFQGKVSYSQSEAASIAQKLMKSSDPRFSPSGKKICKVLSEKQFGEWIEK